MHGISIAVSGLGEAGQQIKSFGAVSHVHESTHKEPRPASQTASSSMHLTLHATRRTPHCAPRLVQAMPAWSVRTRRLQSRHRSDSRVYGHMTTAVHGTRPPTHTHRDTHRDTHANCRNGNPVAFYCFGPCTPSPDILWVRLEACSGLVQVFLQSFLFLFLTLC